VAVIKARYIAWIIGAVAAGLVAIHVGPLLNTHSAQDACSFGDISNEEYRLRLSRASIGYWRPLLWDDDIASIQLSRKYRQLVGDPPTAAAKVAAAHAVLRALGADLHRFDDFRKQFEDGRVTRTFVYEYLLDINRLFYFAPMLRQMMITVIIDEPFLNATPPRGGDPPISVHFPNIHEGVFRIERNLDERGCPPVPAA
jgi:hypothetical protein